MMKKLTITVSEDVYNGLHATIGAGKISRFIDRIARPYVVERDIADGYKAMAMDKQREAEAAEWIESLIDETR